MLKRPIHHHKFTCQNFVHYNLLIGQSCFQIAWLMETEDVADAVDAIRLCWGSESDYTDDELFARARLQWRDEKRSDTAAKEFVLQVVACRLERQLLLWLLQPHPVDAMEDMQTLFKVCTDPYFTAQGLELVKPMLDALLCVAVVRAAACERSVETRKRRMAEFMEAMERTVLMNSRACSALRSLQKCEADKDAEAWMQFLALPHALDPQLFNSRNGRAFMDEAGQVIALQQAELARSRRGWDDIELEGDEYATTATATWDFAMQLVALINTESVSSDDVQDEDEAEHGYSLVAVSDMASLEKYLKEKAPALPPSTNNSPDQDIAFDDDDVEESAMERLSNICSSAEEELPLSSDLLEKVFKELSAVKSLEVVSIQASFLLGLQMRHTLCFLDRCETAKDEFERRIRRVFNRLTGKARDLEHVASLVVLASFCPSQVIGHCVRGARTGVLHHGLYLEIFRASPLLLDLNEERERGLGSQFEHELQQTLLEVSSNQSSFDRESQSVVLFLLSLAGISSSPSFQRKAPILTASKLIDCVLNPLLRSAGQRSEIHFNLDSLIQQVFQQFVTANMGKEIGPTVLERSLRFVLATLSSVNSGDLVLGVHVRERLLLLLKNTMELMPDPASLVLEQFDMPLNSQLWTLMGLFNNDLGNDELCKGLNDVAAVESYVQGEEEANSLATLSLPNVISAVQVLLWGLLWDSTLSTTASVQSTKAEAWKLMDAIATYEFPGLGSTEETMKGSLLIQSAAAEMMLECGSVLFQALLSNVIPYVLEYEPTTTEEDTLKIPEWAAQKLADKAEVRLQISCALASTHAIMRYVVKCWGLSGAVNIQLAAPPNPLLVESLCHVLGAFDPAIVSSQRSLSGSLFCFQWLCFVVSASCELHLNAVSSWPTARTQLELALLRLLHQLDQMKGIATEEAHFSQHFVAAWLACLPVGQFDQVLNFVASRVGT